MKSYKIRINEEKELLVNRKELSYCQISLTDHEQAPQGAEMSIWGFYQDEEEKVNKEVSWLKQAIEIGDSLTIECVEADTHDQPSEVEELGSYVPFCSYCGKSRDEVICLIESKFKMGRICNECIDMCQELVQNFKAKRQ